jgi:HSP20 family protein
VRLNPWTDLNRLERDVLSFFDNRSKEFTKLRGNGDAHKPLTWQPAVDVYEDATRILLVADLPGLEEKDLEISLDNNVLTLKGERKPAPAPDGDKDLYRRVERVQGAFARSFTLPPTVDGERIGAELKAGVLTLTLPKKAEAQPRHIKVSNAT